MVSVLMDDDDPIGTESYGGSRWFYITFPLVFISLNLLMAWNQFA